MNRLDHRADAARTAFLAATGSRHTSWDALDEPSRDAWRGAIRAADRAGKHTSDKGPTGICPTCGLRVGYLRDGQNLAGHYNPANPPVYGAWVNCPGPTPEQKADAAALGRGGR